MKAAARPPKSGRGKDQVVPDGKTVELPEALAFLQVLWEVDHALSRRSKAMRAAIGITGPQRLALRIIGRFPQVSAGDVAALLRVDPSTVTGILDRLTRAGMVQRVSDAKDGRRALFTLTARGRAVDRKIAGTAEASVIRVLDNETPERIAAAKRLLLAIATELSR